jgi:hypothetical protein
MISELIIIGGTILIGYIIFDRSFPRRPIVPMKGLDLNAPVVFGQNHINPPTIDGDEYVFTCRVKPLYSLANGDSYKTIKVPDEYIIRYFRVGVDLKNNQIQYVDLGASQYHCDQNPNSNYLFIGELRGKELTKENVFEIMKLMMTYDLENPMRFEHWDNSGFVVANK